MNIIVQKFGGSSLGDIQKITDAAAIIKNNVEKGYSVVAVASAMGDSTDDLLLLSAYFDTKKSKREMDMLLASGEQVSASLLAMALNANDVPATVFTGWQAGIITDETYGSAEIKRIETHNLLKCLKLQRVAVVTGYQGATESGSVTTLGRGGSDTTAVALAGALKAERCDIFTDVDGIYSCDPKMCQSAIRYDTVSYFEMLRFAQSGALVMAPSAMEIGAKNDIALRVRSASKPDDKGTLICREANTDFVGVAADSQQEIFSCRKADSLVELARMQNFKLRALEAGIPIEVVCRVGKRYANKAYFSFSNRHVHNVPALLTDLAQDLALPLEHVRSLAKLSLISHFHNTNDAVNKVFSNLLHHKVCPRYWSIDNGTRISVWIDASELTKAASALHCEFVHERLQVPA